MSTFTRAELLALEPSDLGDLINMAEGANLLEKALSLGLDPYGAPEDWHALERAVRGWDGPPDPHSPPIGAGHGGVRSDLTPYEQGAPAPIDAEDDGLPIDLGAVQPDIHTAKELAALMDRSAATGEPFLAGTFAMYAAPSGEVVMVTEGIGDGIKRSVVPKAWVTTALNLMAGKGGKMSLLKGLFGRG